VSCRLRLAASTVSSFVVFRGRVTPGSFPSQTLPRRFPLGGPSIRSSRRCPGVRNPRARLGSPAYKCSCSCYRVAFGYFLVDGAPRF
jgi:hypothetical protein